MRNAALRAPPPPKGSLQNTGNDIGRHQQGTHSAAWMDRQLALSVRRDAISVCAPQASRAMSVFLSLSALTGRFLCRPASAWA
jgi:hypothetical protein